MKKIFIIVISCFFVFVHTIIYSKVMYKSLDGVCIVLDAGHGGKDQGANFEGVNEETINLSIVLKIKNYLEKEGAIVKLTRNNHDALSKNENWKKNDMKKRVEITNQKEHDLMISIHLNSFHNQQVKGSQVFYNHDERLANSIDYELKKVTNSKLMIKKGDYYILNESNIPSLLIECGFLSNLEERMKLQDEKYQEKIAKAISKGIKQYFSMLN